MVEMPDGVKIEMKWKSIYYIKDDEKLVFDIEPMMNNSCIIYFPDEKNWISLVEKFSLNERLEIIFLLERIKWKRIVNIIVADIPVKMFSSNQNIEEKGSMENTEAGRKIESSSLFDPNSKLTAAQVQSVYLKLEEQYCVSLKGTVTLKDRYEIKGSVFDEFILPLLKKNKQIQIVSNV